jgi:hypothetical protein
MKKPAAVLVTLDLSIPYDSGSTADFQRAMAIAEDLVHLEMNTDCVKVVFTRIMSGELPILDA